MISRSDFFKYSRLPRCWNSNWHTHRHGRRCRLASSCAVVVELGIPAGAAACRRQVENVPERRRIGCTSWILAWIRGSAQLRSPKMPYPALQLHPHVQRRPFAAIGSKAPIVTWEGIIGRGEKAEIPPAALAGEGELPGHGRTPDHRHRDALRDVARRHIERAQKRRAHGTWPFPLGTVHPKIGDQRIVVAEQAGQANGSP